MVVVASSTGLAVATRTRRAKRIREEQLEALQLEARQLAGPRPAKRYKRLKAQLEERSGDFWPSLYEADVKAREIHAPKKVALGGPPRKSARFQ